VPLTEASRREVARQRFSTAVLLARDGRYAAAKALFLEAYAAEPHYLVLYNIAQAELQLGELASAASFLRRFLAEGGTAVSPERRAAVEEEIRRIDALQAEPPEPVGAPLVRTEPAPPDVAAARSSITHSTAPPAPSGTAILAAPESSHGIPVTLAPLSLPSARAPEDDTARLWGYVLTTSGFALLGSAVGLYTWNHERYNRWQGERAELLTTTQQGVPVESERAVNQRVRESNARLASIKSFDPIPIITASVGVAAMGVGLWTLIDTRGSDQVELSSTPSELVLRVRGAW
jgi:hypothetical protein